MLGRRPAVRPARELTGHTVARVALRGLAVVADYQRSWGGRVVFRGHGLLTYDTKCAEYLLHWFGGSERHLQTFRGDFEGDVLTMSRAGPLPHHRLSCDFSEPGRFRMRLEASDDGGAWHALLLATYDRKH